MIAGALSEPLCGLEGARGKSELHRAGCWITSSGGDPKESATENRPPRGCSVPEVRVKR